MTILFNITTKFSPSPMHCLVDATDAKGLKYDDET